MSTDPGARQLYPQSTFGEKVAGLPTGRDVEWEPLVDYRRNGVSENTCLLYTSDAADE